MAEKEMQSADVCTHKNKIKTSFAKIFVSGTPDRPCFSFCREGEPLSFLSGEGAIRRMYLCCVYVTIQGRAQKGKRKFLRPW